MDEKNRKQVNKFLDIQIDACDKIIDACEHWKVHYLKLAYMNVKEVLRQYKEDVKEFVK